MTAATDTNILNIAALANDYCVALQSAAEMEKLEFIEKVLSYLPRLYFYFSDTEMPDCDEGFLTEHLDEDLYDSIRNGISAMLGTEDTYLETFMQDMKYSDTPIATSISEGLADIFQDLYNFTEEIRLSEGLMAKEAFMLCKESFAAVWSFTLCNVMRALNALRYSSDFNVQE